MNILQRVPDDIFKTPSDYGYYLLAVLSNTGNFPRAERYLMDWFVKDPINCATAMTNFYFGLLPAKEDSLLNPSSTVGVSLGGVVYETDNERPVTRLLVDIEQPTHEPLLSINSPLGKLLSSMEVGEVQQHGITDIKLLEKLLPYVAAIRIAFDIRHRRNDGNDVFQKMTLPKNPEEIPAFFERKLGAIANNKSPLDDYPNIPLSMRGYKHNKNFPVRAAIHQLINDSTSKVLPGFGMETPDTIVMDVYSIMYFVITGLIYGLETAQVNVILTSETKCLLEEWIKDINREDYLTIGVSPQGGLFRHTSEDIQRYTKDWQAAIHFILSRSTIEHPSLVDMPPILTKLNQLVDLSVASSLKLAYANKINWLSIDGILTQYVLPLGIGVVNTFSFATTLGTYLSIEQKHQGLALHAEVNLPYPLTYQEMFQLGHSKNDHDRLLLSKLLYKYPNTFSTTQEAVDFLSAVARNVLLNGFCENGRLVYPDLITRERIQCVLNTCCYISMQCQDGQTAERKLALFIIKIFKPLLWMEQICNFVSCIFVRFIRGHFLSFNVIKEHILESALNDID